MRLILRDEFKTMVLFRSILLMLSLLFSYKADAVTFAGHDQYCRTAIAADNNLSITTLGMQFDGETSDPGAFDQVRTLPYTLIAENDHFGFTLYDQDSSTTACDSTTRLQDTYSVFFLAVNNVDYPMSLWFHSGDNGGDYVQYVDLENTPPNNSWTNVISNSDHQVMQSVNPIDSNNTFLCARLDGHGVYNPSPRDIHVSVFTSVGNCPL